MAILPQMPGLRSFWRILRLSNQAYPKGDSADEFVYFTSEVEVLIMEQRDQNNVYFYLPGAVMERDGLKYPNTTTLSLK